MANRNFKDDSGFYLFNRVVHLFPVVSVGAAGAVTLKKRQFRAAGVVNSANSTLVDAPTSGIGYAYGDGAGVRSVVRTDTGDWTITLSDSYQWLIGVSVCQMSSTDGLWTSGYGVGVVSGSTNVATNTATGNGGVIAIVLDDGDGAAADPADGDTLTLHIILGDSTEP